MRRGVAALRRGCVVEGFELRLSARTRSTVNHLHLFTWLGWMCFGPLAGRGGGGAGEETI